MNQASSQVMFVEFVEVEISQFVVADPVRKRVVDSHQDLVGYRYCRTLVTSPRNPVTNINTLRPNC